MIRRVRIVVGVALDTTRAEYESGPELGSALARYADSVTGAPGLDGAGKRRRIEELEECHIAYSGRGRGFGPVVHQHGKRNALVFYEGTGMLYAPRADRYDVRAAAPDLFIFAAQLRRVMSAVQSTEVAHEH